MSQHGTTQSILLGAVMLAGVASASEPGTPSAHAGGAGVHAGAGGMQATLDSKLRLVKLLLDQSPAVLRIPYSGNAQAKKDLADAQAAYVRAGNEAVGGRLEQAIGALDDALRKIVSASHLVPDPQQVAAQEKARFTQLREAIRAFQSRYGNAAAGGGKAGKTVPAAELGRIGAMVEKADALAAGGNHAEANTMLADGYRLVVTAMNRVLASETIVYNATFASAAEEYSYELARNQSYEELIPIALAQLNSPRETAALSEQYVRQSRTLRENAKQQAAGGDQQAAVKTMQDATGQLQKALRIAGLTVPQSDAKP
jgi:hypothetical protein